jgi:hypothetical protein
VRGEPRRGSDLVPTTPDRNGLTGEDLSGIRGAAMADPDAELAVYAVGRLGLIDVALRGAREVAELGASPRAFAAVGSCRNRADSSSSPSCLSGRSGSATAGPTSTTAGQGSPPRSHRISVSRANSTAVDIAPKLRVGTGSALRNSFRSPARTGGEGNRGGRGHPMSMASDVGPARQGSPLGVEPWLSAGWGNYRGGPTIGVVQLCTETLRPVSVSPSGATAARLQSQPVCRYQAAGAVRRLALVENRPGRATAGYAPEPLRSFGGDLGLPASPNDLPSGGMSELLEAT